jgi:HPt (histidine-containing phosphotransfer) domain-containing protein
LWSSFHEFLMLTTYRAAFLTVETRPMRPLIDEARHLEIRRLVGEEAYRELLDQFCLDAAWILEALAAGCGEDSPKRSRHALTGLAANFGFPHFAELSRTALPTETGHLSDELERIRDMIFRANAAFG